MSQIMEAQMTCPSKVGLAIVAVAFSSSFMISWLLLFIGLNLRKIWIDDSELSSPLTDI